MAFVYSRYSTWLESGVIFCAFYGDCCYMRESMWEIRAGTFSQVRKGHTLSPTSVLNNGPVLTVTVSCMVFCMVYMHM